ncbi:unnamed protein product [Penicillium salamii]|uniref:Heterokaryon incompatibility domain-containing protein n=1 Tax=Penicillium salamii TaxID=1612424 RepID=A0A9W4IE70_9EURO|nr:unnamed protein product [Penicillium salamii]CAG8102344.1 unnamed protein product [Penicillium salamii]CAG8104085.1 unnamed protein product [Penicillium salamii]CAG8118510.1 unnamed protein product [Penicillium salamii]CAG8290044.1 unnamed protein product [Penicillium salamii]
MDITTTMTLPSDSLDRRSNLTLGVTEEQTTVRKEAIGNISPKWNHISSLSGLAHQHLSELLSGRPIRQRWKLGAFLRGRRIRPEEYFKYERLPPERRATFRLLTLLPGKDFEQIRCELTVATIHDAEYEALSYSWGTDATLPTIMCNGARMNVSRNLKRALKDLRYADRPRVLWADAICINQSDLIEKENQVNQMGDIYRHAKRTIIHMHKGFQLTGVERPFLVLQELQRLYHYLCAGKIDLTTVLDAAAMKLKVYKGRIPTLVMLEEMGSLTWDSYFRRMWIVQEVALAKHVSVSYHGYEFEWDFFKEAMLMRAVILLEANGVATPASLFDVFVLQLIAMRENFQRNSISRQFNLLSLLNFARVFSSSNPLDKVYGVFGLTSSNLEEMGLRANYTRSAEDLYIDVAAGVLKESPNLDIMSIAGLPQAKPGINSCPLPSWVPDWRNSQFYPRPLVFRNPRGVYEYWPYNASKDSVYNFRTLPSNPRKELLVRGCFHDRISDLTMIMHPASNYMDCMGVAAIRTKCSPKRAPLEVVAAWSTIPAHDVRHLLEKKDMRAFLKRGSSERSNYRPTNEPIQLAQMRTLCSGHVPFNEEVSMRTFKYWLESGFGIDHDIRYQLEELGVEGVYSSPCARPWFGKMCSMVLGRRLLWTEREYLGLAPPGAKKGDHVVVLEGSRVPFVLRKVDGGFWKVIGECYVHGIMYGEAFDAQKCEDIILV